MKKTRLTLLCLLLLTALLLLNACGQPTVDLKKMIDTENFSTDIPSTGTAVDALKGSGIVLATGALAKFTEMDTDSTTYRIYNIETNTVVHTETSTSERTVTVDLVRMDYGTVITVYSNFVNPTDGQKPHRAIYNEAGELIAEADDANSPNIACDLIHFDSKVYRMAEDGSIAHAFDWSPLNTFPRLEQKIGKFYVAESYSNDSFKFYDSDLKYVSTLELPSYANEPRWIPLSSGKVLIQYTLDEPEDAEDYTFLGSIYDPDDTEKNDKHTLKTLIYTPKSDKIEEIDFDYYIIYALLRLSDPDEWKENALSDDYDAILVAAPITNKRIDTSEAAVQMMPVKKNGKISTLEIAAVDNEKLESWTVISEDRWLIETQASTYLLNKKGKILGEVGGASHTGGYLSAGGKLFNFDMDLVFDYKAADLSWFRSYKGCILFENKDDELICFAGGNQTTLIAKDSKRQIYSTSSYNFFVIRDDSASKPCYEIYNENGVKLLSLTDLGEAPVFNIVMTGENGELLISCPNNGDGYLYFRLG